MRNPQTEKVFLERGEEIAELLEAKARYVRCILMQDLTATERAAEIVAECDGVGAHSLKVLIKRAVLADKEQGDE